MRAILLLLTGLLLPLAAPAQQDLQSLLQMLGYVGVDYAAAVADGEIISQAEYREMQEFSGAVGRLIAELPKSEVRAKLAGQAAELARAVEQRAPVATVAALTADMSRQLIAHFNVTAAPRRAPDLALGAELYATHCAACHGAEGRGNGPAAAGIEPAPTNFHDLARYRQRALYGLYNTISLGVAGTAMPSFAELTAHQRWSLAFYVGQLAPEPATVLAGKALAQNSPLAEPQALATLTPSEAQTRYGDDALAAMAWLRSHPGALFAQSSPLATARSSLAKSLASYRSGDREAAYSLALAAYLEGFELVEASLNAVAPELRLETEQAMMRYRTLLQDQAPAAALSAQADAVYQLLDQAEARLHGDALAGVTAFLAAFFILLREGLEALLVVAALSAFLIKTERRDAMPYLHAGWIGALAFGAVTWLAAVLLIDISGAGRELTEGIAALVAAAVLFYVGFWMHNKTHAGNWQRFIQGNVTRALGRGTLWGLAGLSFIAVYREVFETILFFQALWVQTDAGGQQMALLGLGAAAVALAVLGWAILRYSVRLPLRQFFGATGVLMLVLAVIFAGKGVVALQEAGLLSVEVLQGFPRIDLLGIYPYVNSLLLQAAMLVVALVVIFRDRLRPLAR